MIQTVLSEDWFWYGKIFSLVTHYFCISKWHYHISVWFLSLSLYLFIFFVNIVLLQEQSELLCHFSYLSCVYLSLCNSPQMEVTFLLSIVFRALVQRHVWNISLETFSHYLLLNPDHFSTVYFSFNMCAFNMYYIGWYVKYYMCI